MKQKENGDAALGLLTVFDPRASIPEYFLNIAMRVTTVSCD